MRTPPGWEGKKGLLRALEEERAAEVTRLAAEAARSLGCADVGLEAAETVIRAGMLRLGAGMLGELLVADPGFRGTRLECGSGHQAEFVSYRDKTSTRCWGAHPAPCLVSLQGLRARVCAPRRRARHRGHLPVPGADRDERQGRGRAVRRGRIHA
jgi:hypothetical protein